MRYVLASVPFLILSAMPTVVADEKTQNPDYIRYAQSSITLSGLSGFQPLLGEVTTQKEFDGLWDVWMPKGKKPSIDFDKLRVVTYISVERWGKVGYLLNEKGEFRFAEEKEKPTKVKGAMLYWIVVLDRAKVKSFNPSPTLVNKVSENMVIQVAEADGKTQTPEWIIYAQNGITVAALARFKPRLGIKTQKDFDALWNLYKPKGKKPSIDFEKHLVVTYESIDAWGKVGYVLKETGEFRFAEELVSPTKGKGSMLYWIVVLDRAKVKSFNPSPSFMNDMSETLVNKVGEKSADLKEFTSAEGKFSVKMPGDPKTSKKQTAVEFPDGAYTIDWGDLPDTAKETEEQLDKRLEAYRDSFIGALKGKLVTDKKIKLANKYPGREYRADLPDLGGMVYARTFMVEGRLYSIAVVGKKEFVEGSNTAKFLDSFAVTK